MTEACDAKSNISVSSTVLGGSLEAEQECKVLRNYLLIESESMRLTNGTPLLLEAVFSNVVPQSFFNRIQP